MITRSKSGSAMRRLDRTPRLAAAGRAVTGSIIYASAPASAARRAAVRIMIGRSSNPCGASSTDLAAAWPGSTAAMQSCTTRVALGTSLVCSCALSSASASAGGCLHVYELVQAAGQLTGLAASADADAASRCRRGTGGALFIGVFSCASGKWPAFACARRKRWQRQKKNL
eukprot:scaffold26111_cov112-Isochrysis_galbana.AAC.1